MPMIPLIHLSKSCWGIVDKLREKEMEQLNKGQLKRVKAWSLVLGMHIYSLA